MFDDFKLIIICVIIVIVIGITTMCVSISFKIKEPVVESITELTPRAEDLATYYEQHKISSIETKKVIDELVYIKFSEFDKEQLVNGALKQFLVNCRFKYKDVK